MKTTLSFTAVFLCATFALGGCVSSGENMSVVPIEFTVVNKTGQTLEELYCSPAFAHFQSSELFDGVVLKNGQSRKLSFVPQFFSSYWDICAVDIDGNEYLATGISSAKTSVITLLSDSENNEDGLYDESEDNLFEFSAFSLDTSE
jgi:hypothetical protein